MSNVASLELCKELYELSGWAETSFYHIQRSGYQGEPKGHFGTNQIVGDLNEALRWTGNRCPAYDLGYLLRKLPVFVRDKQMQHSHNHGCPSCTCEKEYHCGLEMRKFGTAYAFSYVSDLHHRAIPFYVTADNPEDAAAKLAIALFDGGVLHKDDSEESKEEI